VNEQASQSPPIPEARPPHLPDVLTRTPLGFYAFAIVAIIAAWADIRAWVGNFPIFEPANVWPLIAQVVPSVVAPLLGAALFLRHPRAHRTMPLLVFGLALLAAGELLDAFETPIRTFLLTLSSPDELPPTPADVAFLVFTMLLSLFAILYVGAGLAAARRRERSAAERPLMIWIVALAIVSGILSLAAVFQVDLDATPFVLLQLAIGLLLSLLVTLAWAYLVGTSVGGWMAGEVPRRAWTIAALAVVVLLLVRLIGGVLSSLAIPGFFGVIEVLIGASTVAWVLLLVAFLLGLPAPTDDPSAATPEGSAGG
jgi:hypothetical protein